MNAIFVYILATVWYLARLTAIAFGVNAILNQDTQQAILFFVVALLIDKPIIYRSDIEEEQTDDTQN